MHLPTALRACQSLWFLPVLLPPPPNPLTTKTRAFRRDSSHWPQVGTTVVQQQQVVRHLSLLTFNAVIVYNQTSKIRLPLSRDDDGHCHIPWKRNYLLARHYLEPIVRQNKQILHGRKDPRRPSLRHILSITQGPLPGGLELVRITLG